MQVDISFNISSKKEILRYKGQEKETPVCNNFIDLLSLDTNFIKNSIIHSIDYSDISSIKKAYKKIYNIQPLLLLDEYNIIEQLDTYTDSSKKIDNISDSIHQLQNLIKNSKNFNTEYTLELKNTLKFLRKKRTIYTKINNNIEQIINNTFNSIVHIIELYREIVNVCFINNTDDYFEGFSKLSPMKKYVFYKMFILKNSDFFKDLPSSNISFTFDCTPDEFNKKIKNEKSQKNVFNILFDENISPMYEYHCQTLEQFLQVSFFTTLSLNLNIKKCENCGKYFIAYQRSDEKYCNRISPQDKNKTCKQFANFENWKNNINSNEELKIYRRIYMAKQMQTRRNPENIDLKKSFESWKKESQRKRNEYIHGNLSKKDFLNWLNTNS